jgi:hypothetical protein
MSRIMAFLSGGTAQVTRSSFERALIATDPDLSSDQIEQHADRLKMYRCDGCYAIDGGYGIDGVQAWDTMKWLVSDSAKSSILPGVLKKSLSVTIEPLPRAEKQLISKQEEPSCVAM